MGDGLHGVIIRVECLGEHLFSVAGGPQSQHFQLDSQLAVFLRQGQKALAHHPQRLALVVGIEGIRHLLLLIHEDELGGRGPGINAQISPQHLPVCGIHRAAQLRLMAP